MAAVLQLMSFVADFGMTPEAAAHQPRIDVSGPDKVTADRRLAPDILRALQADGPVEVVEHGVLPINFACPNLIDAARTARAPASATRPRPGRRRWRRREVDRAPLRTIASLRRQKSAADIVPHGDKCAFGTLFPAARGEGRRGDRRRRSYFVRTRTGLPASHALMSSTMCVK